jgi:hypothetical protein
LDRDELVFHFTRDCIGNTNCSINLAQFVSEYDPNNFCLTNTARVYV